MSFEEREEKFSGGGGVKASVLLLNLHLRHQWCVIELLATLGGKTVINHHSFVDAGPQNISRRQDLFA